MEKSEEEKNWEDERNVEIVFPTLEDLDELKDFSYANLYQDEPLTYNLNIASNNSFFGKKFQKIFWDMTMISPIRSHMKVPSSLLAKDKTTGKIFAMRIGEIKRRTAETMMEISKEPDFRFMGNLPTLIPVPRTFVIAGNIQWIFDQLKYSRKTAFEAFENDESIYFSHNITVAREARGKGLGKELIRRAMRMAEKAGCGHTYTLATSIYSQRIFKNLGFKVLEERSFEEFKVDRRGRPLLWDPKEHKTIQVVVFDHSQI